jgi:cleavage stimulation factor subunit 3
MIDERSRDFLNVKRVTKEFETLARAIDRNIPCVPPASPQSGDEIKQLAAWRKLITWERLNPLKTEDALLVTRRVVLAYEQCLLCLGYHTDLWYEVCAYLEQTSRTYSERGDAHLSKRFLDEAATLYERATQTYMRSNMLIHFAYADLEEQRLNVDKARAIYNRLLDVNEANLKDPTLAYIQAMRFERRADGIKSARTVFKRAREDIRTNHQIYVAAALMEYYCSKDNNIAFNIFNLGLKKYGQNVDYILAYIDYMTHLNEDHNARVLFERVVSADNSISKQLQPAIWHEFLKFESQVGDLLSIKKVEKRRFALYSDLHELEGRETLLLVDRYKFLNLLPCSMDELKLLGYKETSQTNLSTTNTSIVGNGSTVNGNALLEQAARDRRAVLPRPDIKHMMPFRPVRKPLPGSHPTSGGVFPLPDTALYLVKVLPPSRNFEVRHTF